MQLRGCLAALAVAASALGSSATLPSSATPAPIPFYSGPNLSPSFGPWGGATGIPGTVHTRLYMAVPSIGTYNHAAMIDRHDGMFLAHWKCAPVDEDQPGQRVLYSQSTDGVTWTTPAELFPNVSTNSNPARLFAEPALHINGNLYAAASPTQFCLYPDQYQDVLLLRRVFTAGGVYGSLGPLFWASFDSQVPAGFEETTRINGILTLNQTDTTTQADIATLKNPLLVPCGPDCADGETKCEACPNGCQDWKAALNVSGVMNERTHYTLPSSGGGDPIDVLLYRNSQQKLFASVRVGLEGNWTVPVPTNISDDVANINAGSMPDGRVYLVSNLMVNPAARDPLFVTTSTDGVNWNATRVVAACNMTAFQSPTQPDGCKERYAGKWKSPGMQYPQAVAVTDPNAEGFWVIFSVNKEDIWVSRVPFAF